MGSVPPLTEMETFGDNIRFGEVLTLTGDVLPRAGRITTRRCGEPSCVVVGNEQVARVTGRELVVDNWSMQNKWVSCTAGLEHTCTENSNIKHQVIALIMAEYLPSTVSSAYFNRVSFSDYDNFPCLLDLQRLKE